MSQPTEWTLYRCEVEGRWLMDPRSFPFDSKGTVRWTKRPLAAREFETAAAAEAAHPGAFPRPFLRNRHGWTKEIEPEKGV